MTGKRRISIEKGLRSSSTTIIWELISTAHGLARWVADAVTEEDGVLTFQWGETWSHHEIRRAVDIKRKKNRLMRFRWEDEEDGGAYVELLMQKSLLTNDYVLHITDFAVPGDEDSLRSLWNGNLEKLHRSSGL